MRQVITVIAIIVSLLLIDARVALCQGAGTTNQSSTANQSQSASVAQMPVKLNEKERKIKRMVDKIGVAGKLTLYLVNGEQVSGNVVSIDEESFQITAIDLKQVITFQYRNVKKVREGYGSLNVFTGKRSNPPKGLNIALFAGVLFVAIGLPLIAIRGTK